MHTKKAGPDMFGIEHEVKPDTGKKSMTDEELRRKAKIYTGKNDKR